MTDESAVVEFADENLKLFVIDELRELGLLPPFDLGAYRAAHPADPEDFAYELEDLGIDLQAATPEDIDFVRDHRPDHGVRVELVTTPVTRSMAAALRTLRISLLRHRPAVHDVWAEWDGESDEFDVRSLQGIEALVNLESLTFDGLAQLADLEPLTRLPALEEFRIDQARLPSLEPLLRCSALRRVRLRTRGGAPLEMVAALRARGLAIDLK